MKLPTIESPQDENFLVSGLVVRHCLRLGLEIDDNEVVKKYLNDLGENRHTRRCEAIRDKANSFAHTARLRTKR